MNSGTRRTAAAAYPTVTYLYPATGNRRLHALANRQAVGQTTESALHQAVGQIPWGHNLVLVEPLKALRERRAELA